MINYRDYRGGLEESLNTSRTYNSLHELFNDLQFDMIKYYGYDERIKQHLFMVLKAPYPLGFIFEGVQINATKNQTETY